MDRFAYWTLTGLTYLFLVMAGFVLFTWICSDPLSGDRLFNFIIFFSSILTMLFFSATSHVLALMIERIYETRQEDYEIYERAEE